MKYKDLKAEMLKNADVKKAYDALSPEYQIISAMINARMEKNLSQQDLADITGINRADISKLENGNSNPSIRTLKRIADGLGKKLEIKFI